MIARTHQRLRNDGRRSKPMPTRVDPMLAQPSDLPADAAAWACEVKWDGIRAVIFVDNARVRIDTRNHNDITAQYPEFLGIGDALGKHEAILDGEIVAFDAAGRPSFQALQARLGLASPSMIQRRAASTPATFVAFDLLYLDGRDTSCLPYEERRDLLRELLPDGEHWQVPAHHVGDPASLFAVACDSGLEGVVVKRLGSTYQQGKRGGDWRKVKCQRRQEFVVGGWTEGQGRRAVTFGALLIGYYDHGQLVYAGRVGSGYSDDLLVALAAQLHRLHRRSSPFRDGSSVTGQTSKWEHARRPLGTPSSPVHYVSPRIVIEVAYTEFTRDGTLRHPVFVGVRTDKPAIDVVCEDRAPVAITRG